MAESFDKRILKYNATKIFINYLSYNLLIGLAVVYLSTYNLVQLYLNKSLRLTSFINLFLSLCGLLHGISLILKGINFLQFYNGNIRKYHRKKVRIEMSNSSPHIKKAIEGTLFILKDMLIIVNYTNEKMEYIFINKNDLDFIENIYVEDEKIDGAVDHLHFAMSYLK